MLHAFSRTELLIGEAGLKRLAESTVAVFGIGGVGSFVVEALARVGVGHLVLIDDDLICLTNLNRQLHATRATVGQAKVAAMKERILAINPQAVVETHQTFYLPGQGDALIRADYDYIVDAIDTVTAKIDIIMQAEEKGIPVISAMGAGNKLDPGQLRVTDLYKTKTCPLAKVMRKELRARGIKALKVVYSEEIPLKPKGPGANCDGQCVCPEGSDRHCLTKRQVPGSISFVPATSGLLIAGVVVRDLLEK
jgi:tRNA threonylcarbamoyladenosine dehydratase